MNRKLDKVIRIRVPDTTKKQLFRFASSKGKTVSTFLRQEIEKALDSEQLRASE